MALKQFHENSRCLFFTFSSRLDKNTRTTLVTNYRRSGSEFARKYMLTSIYAILILHNFFVNIKNILKLTDFVLKFSDTSENYALI